MTTSTMNNQKSISVSDTLYVRAVYMGKQLFNLRICDVCSMSQALSRVREHLTGVSGLVKISLRNASQGWSTDRWCAA